MASAGKPKSGANAGLTIGLLILCWAGYNWADGYGWIAHSAKTNVIFPKHAWEVGEYLMCDAVTVPNSESNLDCSRDVLNPGTVREMDVTLYGQINDKPLTFKCQRTAESISCHLP
jgi:hypothetical protein